MYRNLTKQQVLQMDRLEMINVLEWNDRNGTYNDEDSQSEGFPPLTKDLCISLICDQFEFE